MAALLFAGQIEGFNEEMNSGPNDRSEFTAE